MEMTKTEREYLSKLPPVREFYMRHQLKSIKSLIARKDLSSAVIMADWLRRSEDRAFYTANFFQSAGCLVKCPVL
jgi:hypothetical protein